MSACCKQLEEAPGPASELRAVFAGSRLPNCPMAVKTLLQEGPRWRDGLPGVEISPHGLAVLTRPLEVQLDRHLPCPRISVWPTLAP